MPSLMTIERSKMSVEMWEKLKSHILRQREKRKQEQEQDAEQERHRREQELKRKRDAMTLEDIKDQLIKLEVKLEEMKGEKHELFLQLKRVLNEDDLRKRFKEREAEYTAQQQLSSHCFHHPYFIPSTTMISANNCQPNLYHRISTPITPQMSSVVANTINTNVMSQQLTNQNQPISVSVHSASPANMALKRSIKRPHEKSPSPPNVPYTGILPVYKTNMSYTPVIPKTSQSSYQLYYPPGGPSQVAYDTKGNPYHILPSGAAFPAEAPSIETNEFDSNKYYQHLRSMNPLSGHSSSSIIPIQTGSTKPGGITSGFPVQRVSGSTSVQVPSSGQARDIRDPSLQYPCYF